MSQLPNNPNIKPAITTHTFRQFCQKVLPSVYDDSLSYYELLCKLTAKINEVITANNQNSEAITELQTLYVELKNYVDNYFKNLDIQPEIDEALNRMAESGDLATIISEYLNGINVYAFKTINDMKSAETIGIGSICRTLGDTDYKTGNGKFYYVRQYLTTDIIDDDNIIALTNNPQAVAEKIPDYFYNTITSNIGNLSNLTTTDKTSTVGAINEVKGVADTNTTNIGTLSNLTTTEKTNTVGAINEVKGVADTNTTSIGTLSNLTTTEKSNTVGAINEVKGVADTNTTSIGTLSNLTTTEKTNTVGAINEVKGLADTNTTSIGTLSNLTTTEKSNIVGAINEIGSIMPIYVPEWFPELKSRLSGTTFGTDPTYSVGAKQATYLKMGRLVFLTLYLKITLSNVGDSNGYATIGNLPFVANNNQRYPLTVAEFGSNIVRSFSDNNMHEVRAFIDSGQNFIKLYDVSGANAMKWVTSGSNANISISGFYLTN